jgi:hypothetical protein
MGQWSGTFEHGLESVDKLATEYEKCTLLAHLDLVKLTCSLTSTLAPFEVKHANGRWPKT